jgi:hypothetical protein
MSGPSAAQQQLQTEQADFYQQAIQQQETTYGEDQSILKMMTGIYEPILAKGPNQEGFSTGEVNDLNSQAVTGTAQNFSQAAKATNEALAAEGGGDAGITSGAADELKQQVGESAAAEESQQESQIKQADYSQGYNEWETAAAGLGEVSGQLNPTGYSGAATSAGSAASTTANEIAQEDNGWINAAIGAAGSIGGGLASNPKLF